MRQVDVESPLVDLLNHVPESRQLDSYGVRCFSAVLLCETDRDIEEVGSPEVELKRTQTIMQGAKYCDFRYRFKLGE